MEQSETLRNFSAAVFNNRYALEVLAAVAKDRPKPRFYVRELARELGLESNDVRPVVERLEQARLVERLPERGPHGAIYFSVVEEAHAFWRLVLGVFEEFN